MAENKINPQNIAKYLQSFAQVAKFRPIWSHWWLRLKRRVWVQKNKFMVTSFELKLTGEVSQSTPTRIRFNNIIWRDIRLDLDSIWAKGREGERKKEKTTKIKNCGQTYKASTIVIYESRVVNISNLLVTSTLES